MPLSKFSKAAALCLVSAAAHAVGGAEAVIPLLHNGNNRPSCWTSKGVFSGTSGCVSDYGLVPLMLDGMAETEFEDAGKYPVMTFDQVPPESHLKHFKHSFTGDAQAFNSNWVFIADGAEGSFWVKADTNIGIKIFHLGDVVDFESTPPPGEVLPWELEVQHAFKLASIESQAYNTGKMYPDSHVAMPYTTFQMLGVQMKQKGTTGSDGISPLLDQSSKPRLVAAVLKKFVKGENAEKYFAAKKFDGIARGSLAPEKQVSYDLLTTLLDNAARVGFGDLKDHIENIIVNTEGKPIAVDCTIESHGDQFIEPENVPGDVPVAKKRRRLRLGKKKNKK
jgi:hypothetical protein